MATLAASQAASGVAPRAIHAGVNSVYAVYSLTATLSAGDIIQMCKLPDNARIVRTSLGVSGYLGDLKLNVGTRSDPDAFIASATATAAVLHRENVATGPGTVLDISDDASTRYTMIEIAVSDSASSSGSNAGSIRLVVEYQLDQ